MTDTPGAGEIPITPLSDTPLIERPNNPYRRFGISSLIPPNILTPKQRTALAEKLKMPFNQKLYDQVNSAEPYAIQTLAEQAIIDLLTRFDWRIPEELAGISPASSEVLPPASEAPPAPTTPPPPPTPS